MKRIVLFVTLTLLSFSAFAQTPQPKAADKPVTVEKKEPPAEAIFTAEMVKELTAKAKDARLAQVEAENLALKIEQAKEQLKKLNEEAQKAVSESQAAYQRAAAKVGIPLDRLEEYQGEQQPDGTLKLKRRPQAK